MQTIRIYLKLMYNRKKIFIKTCAHINTRYIKICKMVNLCEIQILVAQTQFGCHKAEKNDTGNQIFSIQFLNKT